MSQTAGDGSGFFATNQLVKVCAGLDNFNLASEGEKANLLKCVRFSLSDETEHSFRSQDPEGVRLLVPD